MMPSAMDTVGATVTPLPVNVWAVALAVVAEVTRSETVSRRVGLTDCALPAITAAAAGREPLRCARLVALATAER